MPRLPRHKSEEATFYHLLSRVAGDPEDFPLHKRRAARKFLSLFEFYLRLYVCRLAGFQLMGNHYHAVVYFEQFRSLGAEELKRRARHRFGKLWRLKTRHWEASDWDKFERDLFDVSCFMQHVNGEFSKWYNHHYRRRGHFWADRFKNPELLDSETVQKVILYCELNAVRAGLVRRPEASRWGSAYWRWAGKKSDLLIPLQELFPVSQGKDAFATYRMLLTYYGALAPEDPYEQWTAPNRVLEHPSSLPKGVFSQRLRCFADGVALGSRQAVRQILNRYRSQGLYKRRKHPIPQLANQLFSLREQRSHAFSPG